MLNVRASLRGKIRGPLTASLLLASSLAAAPAAEYQARQDQIWFTENYYSDATYTVRVGRGYQTCDGEYGIINGYPTPYSIIQFQSTCP